MKYYKKSNSRTQSLRLFFFLSVISFTVSLNCLQNLFAKETDYFPPALGPTLSWEGGVNGITTPRGRKNGFTMNKIPNAGLTLYLPLSLDWNLGLNLDLTYNNHSFLMKYNYNSKKEEYMDKDRFQFNYVSIAPTFNHSGFNIGFSFGIPVGGIYEGIDIPAVQLNNLWEVKAGWTYPIYYDETGKLNFYISANYALNGVYKNFTQDDPLRDIVPAIEPQTITNYYNPRPAGVQIGFNFLFSLIILPDEYYE